MLASGLSREDFPHWHPMVLHGVSGIANSVSPTWPGCEELQPLWRTTARAKARLVVPRSFRQPTKLLDTGHKMVESQRAEPSPPSSVLDAKGPIAQEPQQIFAAQNGREEFPVSTQVFNSLQKAQLTKFSNSVMGFPSKRRTNQWRRFSPSAFTRFPEYRNRSNDSCLQVRRSISSIH